MRFILRADASKTIGSGHVMRLSAIAEELIARGEFVVFVGQISDLSWLKERITTLGFKRIYKEPSDFISNPASDVLILDSYDVGVDNHFISLKNWLHVIAIVDEVTPDYSCTLRIHPGLDSNWIGNSSLPTLSGPKYIPFRSSLSKKISSPKKDSEVLKVVVVAGGSDPHSLVLELSKILANFRESFEAYLFTNLPAEVISDPRFRNCQIGSSLDDVTKDANLVLTTSSTSSLEFIARGLCVGIVCAVDNQKQYYKQLGQLGVAAQIGIRTESAGWDIKINTLQRLLTDPGFRMKLTNRAIGLIDFGGARRIVDVVKSL
jgi:spore coat polysaccharide biosynthesis predicted glycosyltransferase SpsG